VTTSVCVCVSDVVNTTILRSRSRSRPQRSRPRPRSGPLSIRPHQQEAPLSQADSTMLRVIEFAKSFNSMSLKVIQCVCVCVSDVVNTTILRSRSRSRPQLSRPRPRSGPLSIRPQQQEAPLSQADSTMLRVIEFAKSFNSMSLKVIRNSHCAVKKSRMTCHFRSDSPLRSTAINAT